MNLNKKIISLIKRKKMSLAIAESCTGGMLSSAITSVSGSSNSSKNNKKIWSCKCSILFSNGKQFKQNQ